MELDNIDKVVERSPKTLICTHNIVPPHRKTEKKDIDAFLKKNYPSIEKDKKPAQSAEDKKEVKGPKE